MTKKTLNLFSRNTNQVLSDLNNAFGGVIILILLLFAVISSLNESLLTVQSPLFIVCVVALALGVSATMLLFARAYEGPEWLILLLRILFVLFLVLFVFTFIWARFFTGT